MGTRTKVILIVVAVLLVCVFAGAIGNQRRSGESGSSNGFVDFLGDRAGSANAVVDGEIEAPCRSAPNTFQVIGTCTLTVEAADAGLRSLVLLPDTAMTVSSRVPREDSTVSDEVDAGEEVRVAIDEQGGPVTLACASVTACVVTLGMDG